MNSQILVVEDDALSRKMLRDLLVANGYRVLAASNAETALTMWESESIDAILMDIRLPGMSGFEALTHIRNGERGANIPVIAVTASVMSGEQARVLTAGFDGFHPKPIQISRLLQDISMLLVR